MQVRGVEDAMLFADGVLGAAGHSVEDAQVREIIAKMLDEVVAVDDGFAAIDEVLRARQLVDVR